MKPTDIIDTACGHIAVITRIEDGEVYGLYCTGPNTPQRDANGGDNEFLLGTVEG